MKDEYIEPGEETPEKDRFGIPDISMPVPLACMVSYIFPLIGGVFFLLVEKTSRMIRFHAAQSVLFWILFILLQAVAGILESELLGKLVSILLLISWCYLIYESLRTHLSRFPFIGDIAYSMIFDESDE
ncbi:MAG: hypothetical protein GF417_00700 [Candidatus Latescibacteria bacterium]|nr:hypothetical protein [bacterium]MBD3422945.1 hypothetical protein [Candidatus Latescibacterota bacterium]